MITRTEFLIIYRSVYTSKMVNKICRNYSIF
ncbi:Uncharacterised protein [Cedecea neteri]|uniref:Uncharacterized protein n=1 Tax=Cedecea neteri TaxID=158822 RepID=A0A2X3KWN8_9ENTR|nr:Uncharacterised protein [Cedecea neteri]